MTSSYSFAVVCRSFAAVASVISGLVSLRLFSLYLIPQVYGAILVAQQVLGYLPFLACGFRMATNRRILGSDDDEERGALIDFGQVCTTWLGLAAVLVSLGMMGLYVFTPAARGADASVMFFLALAFAGALTFTTGLQAQLLIALRAQAWVFLIMGLQSLLNVLVLWISFKAGVGIYAFPVATLLSALAALAVTVVLVRRRLPGISLLRFRVGPAFRQRFLDLIREASDCLRCDLSIFLLFTADVIIVGMLVGPEAAAAYGIVVRLFTILRSFLQSASEAAWPITAERRSEGLALMQVILRANAWVYGAVVGVLWVCFVPCTVWYMGADWALDDVTARIMIMRLLIVGVSTPSSFGLYGLGRFSFIRRCAEWELMVSVVLGVLLGYWMGVRGVAIGFLFGACCGTLLPLQIAYAREVGVPAPVLLLGAWARALGAGAVAGFAAVGVPATSRAATTLMVRGAAGLLGSACVAAIAIWVRLRGSVALPAPVTWRERLSRYLKGM